MTARAKRVRRYPFFYGPICRGRITGSANLDRSIRIILRGAVQCPHITRLVPVKGMQDVICRIKICVVVGFAVIRTSPCIYQICRYGSCRSIAYKRADPAHHIIGIDIFVFRQKRSCRCAVNYAGLINRVVGVFAFIMNSSFHAGAGKICIDIIVIGHMKALVYLVQLAHCANGGRSADIVNFIHINNSERTGSCSVKYTGLFRISECVVPFILH